ncbi:MAG: 4-(cytidine 5'-diphospho)-2-C-methyl-D-erythritol kinase, partial [Acidimicrobiia bacterium]|nr:4-(cytidine 5'-diphospho)-2-C-methyl-D-erythritol kinase [Acidimicrobiia bacterium]
MSAGDDQRATGVDAVTVLLKAPAKLTLSLRITDTLPNGFHEIDAEMVTLDLCDDVEVTERQPTSIELIGASVDVPAGPENLVHRALDHVGRQAQVKLVKRIPSKAGLGGGSADAAAILRWAGVSDPLEVVELGSDVAFCLIGGRARVTGAGECIDPLPFEEREVTLLHPPLACSTVEVFRAWDRLGGPVGPGPNDLVQAALAVQPALARWRDRLRDAT